MQASKAPRRQEAVAVSVVQLLPSCSRQAAADSEYLLVQRPEKGLLAGVSEPCIGTKPVATWQKQSNCNICCSEMNHTNERMLHSHVSVTFGK